MASPMIKRVRDRIRQIRPREFISYKEWTVIEGEFNHASLFMKLDNPLYTMMISDLREAEAIIIQNRVHEVREVHIITDVFQKIFIKEKKVQIDELVGQIKYIRAFIADLNDKIDRKVRLERLEAEGKVVINRNQEKEEPNEKS